MDKIEGLSAKEAMRGMIRIGKIFDEAKIISPDGTSKIISASMKMLPKNALKLKKARLARKVDAGIFKRETCRTLNAGAANLRKTKKQAKKMGLEIK